MKIISNIFLSLLALCLVACTGIFILFQVFDASPYLPQLTQRVSVALGRPVSIGGLGLGFSSTGITLDAGPVIIADDSNFTQQPFIKVDKISFMPDIKALLVHHELDISEVIVKSPQIHFILSAEGVMNIHSIRLTKTPSVMAGESVQSSKTAVSVPLPAVNMKPAHRTINIRRIKIRDASISFIDQTQNFPLDIWLKHINANLNDLSLAEPIQLTFNASSLVLKGISPGSLDSQVFKDITGSVQWNTGDSSAKGGMTISGGTIKDFNIFRTAMSYALAAFGGVGFNIDNLLSTQLKNKLSSSDTNIKSADFQLAYHDKTFFIDKSSIKTDILEMTAQGSIDGGLNMDMQTMLYLNEDVSTAFVSELEGFSVLCDDSKRIAIGASLQGVIPHLKYKLNKDFRKKSRKVLMQEGGNILGVLLGGGQASHQGQTISIQFNGKKDKKKFKEFFKNLVQ